MYLRPFHDCGDELSQSFTLADTAVAMWCRKLQYVSFALVTLLSLGLVACGGDDEKNNKDDGPECAAGEMLVDGECQPTRRNNNDNMDAGPSDGGESPDGDNQDPDTSNQDDGQSGPCGNCGPNSFCLEAEGRCVSKVSCQPNEVLGCYNDTTVRKCSEDGKQFHTESCPNDKPNCVDFQKPGCNMHVPKCFESKCTDKSCTPDTKFCDNNTLMKCGSDGMSSSQVKLCRSGCRGGECVDPCGGTVKSFIGCGFYAVDLDNFRSPCKRECPQGICEPLTARFGTCKSDGSSCTPQCADRQGNPGVCLQSGYCQSAKTDKQQFAVTVSNTTMKKIEDVTVTDAMGSQVKKTDLPADSLKVIDLPRADKDGTYRAKNAYHLKASGPVTVHQFNPKNRSGVFSNDASLLLPATTLGTDYRVLGWPNLAEGLAAYATIVAVEEKPQQPKTQVTVSTPVKLAAGGGVGSIAANSSRSFSLEKGEVLKLAVAWSGQSSPASQNDPTGMKITTNGNKLAVFSGHQCANAPLDTPPCDHLEQQLYPVKTWDKQYVFSKFKPRGTEDDIYRVLAAQDNTQITTKPSTAANGKTINAGEVLEFKSTGSVYVEATKPISAGQFMVGSTYPGPNNGCDIRSGQTSGCKIPTKAECNGSGIGDPAFMLNTPTTQYRKDYVVQTPKDYKKDYLNFVIPPNTAVSLDGNNLSSSGSQVGGTQWRVIQKKVQPGVHRVHADKPIGLYAYGYDCDVSYAYPGGLNLESNSP